MLYPRRMMPVCGVTHEQHKRNYQNISWPVAAAWQITKEEQYARYVKESLLQYAAVRNTRQRHPKRKDQPGGTNVMANLNDCVWHAGYDAAATIVLMTH